MSPRVKHATISSLESVPTFCSFHPLPGSNCDRVPVDWISTQRLPGLCFRAGVLVAKSTSDALLVRPAAVELHEFAEPSRTPAALAISGSPAPSRRTQAVVPQQMAQGFATERKALALGLDVEAAGL